MKLNREIFKQILTDYYNTYGTSLPYVLAIDFDATLSYSNYPECGEPTPIVDFIKSIQDLPITIILTTCRENEALVKAITWCREQGLRINYVNQNDPKRIQVFNDCRKIFCNMLIDDTSYGFNMEDFVS